MAPDRVTAALRVVGSILAEAGPLVVVVDDVHRATASTWDHLAALAEGLVPGGGLLALGYRRPEIESSPGWPIVQGWERRSLATIIPLAPLTRADVAHLVADTTLAADEVYAATGGVPFAVGEVLAERDRAVDGDIATLIRRRLDGLSGVDRQALEAAAVLGDRVDSRIWCETLGTSPLDLAAVSARLISARWLTQTATGNAFVHDNLRSAVYDQIDDAQLVAWHERATTAITAHDPSNARALAYHFDRAGRARDAARAHRAAGRHLRREAAYSEALDSWHRALELLPRRATRTRLEVGLEFIEVCDIIGGRAEQGAVLDDVIDDARRLHDDRALLRALLIAGGAAARGGDVAGAENSLAEARELAAKLDDRAALADAAYRNADLLIQSGRWPEGRRAFAVARELVDPDGDRLLHGRILRGLAISSVRTGRPLQAIGWLETAVAAYRDAGDTLNELVTATNLPMAYYEVGDWDRMVAAADDVLPLARRLGDETNVGIANHALALGAHAVGDRPAAGGHALAAEACWTASGRRRLVGIGINLRGLISEDDGDVDAAIQLYAEALAIAEETNAATEAAYASHDLGALLVGTGRAAEALPLLRDAVAHWRETGYPLQQAKSEAVVGLALLELESPPVPEAEALADAGVALLHTGDTIGEHPQVWLWALARLLDRLDRHDERIEVLAAARAELLRQAATIADPQRRRGFFELVPVNTAIVAASQAEQTAPTVTTVRLASVTAPLGRTLRPDEFVDVTWTVDLPDDELVPAGAARRHARLKRLLAEANDQGAAPTDDALAAALGVSRRTIIRDLAALGDDVAPTRRRAATRR